MEKNSPEGDDYSTLAMSLLYIKILHQEWLSEANLEMNQTTVFSRGNETTSIWHPTKFDH
jgi:hypothetical protein